MSSQNQTQEKKGKVILAYSGGLGELRSAGYIRFVADCISCRYFMHSVMAH
jgi:hypothetical protein